jgi:hypothetical protein
MLLEDRIPRTFARVVRNIGPFDSVAWIDEQQQERIQVGPFESMHDTRLLPVGPRGAGSCENSIRLPLSHLDVRIEERGREMILMYAFGDIHILNT